MSSALYMIMWFVNLILYLCFTTLIALYTIFVSVEWSCTELLLDLFNSSRSFTISAALTVNTCIQRWGHLWPWAQGYHNPSLSLDERFPFCLPRVWIVFTVRYNATWTSWHVHIHLCPSVLYNSHLGIVSP